MKILIIEQNCLWSDFQRENRERFWIKELRVLHPQQASQTVWLFEATIRGSGKTVGNV
jgi:hypothetical protein